MSAEVLLHSLKVVFFNLTRPLHVFDLKFFDSFHHSDTHFQIASSKPGIRQSSTDDEFSESLFHLVDFNVLEHRIAAI